MRGWLYCIWRLIQPVEADPPGFGWTWDQVTRINPTIAAFICQDEKSVLAMESRMRALRMKADGTSAGDARKQADEYMRELRKRFTGRAERE